MISPYLENPPLTTRERRALETLRKLAAWADFMGGFDAPVWDEIADLIAELEAAAR